MWTKAITKCNLHWWIFICRRRHALKEQDKFDEAAQRIAYNRALTAAKKALTQETITFIKETFGDLDSYLKPMIEAQVRSQKTSM